MEESCTAIKLSIDFYKKMFEICMNQNNEILYQSLSKSLFPNSSIFQKFIIDRDDVFPRILDIDLIFENDVNIMLKERLSMLNPTFFLIRAFGSVHCIHTRDCVYEVYSPSLERNPEHYEEFYDLVSSLLRMSESCEFQMSQRFSYNLPELFSLESCITYIMQRSSGSSYGESYRASIDDSTIFDDIIKIYQS